MPYQLWIEEPDKPVWHHARMGGPSAFLVTCGWLVPNRDGRLWPQKSGEAGPDMDQRCHDCVAGRVTPA